MTRKSEDDLDKISDVLLEFSENKRIVEALEKIGEFGVSGGEKWRQVELALFRAHADDTIAEWGMKHNFDTDKRTPLVQSRLALDIGFRLKRHAKDEWYFVELKQADNYPFRYDKPTRIVPRRTQNRTFVPAHVRGCESDGGPCPIAPRFGFTQ